MSNYRPLSVLSIFASILEKIVHDQLIDHFKEKQMLNKNQHAFCKLHSTITSSVKSTNEWLNNIDSQKDQYDNVFGSKKGLRYDRSQNTARKTF